MPLKGLSAIDSCPNIIVALKNTRGCLPYTEYRNCASTHKIYNISGADSGGWGGYWGYMTEALKVQK